MCALSAQKLIGEVLRGARIPVIRHVHLAGRPAGDAVYKSRVKSDNCSFNVLTIAVAVDSRKEP